MKRVASIALTVTLLAILAWLVLPISAGDSFPKCNSGSAEEAAKRAIAEGPSGKIAGLAIIDMRNAHEVSATDTIRQCVADVTLNNGTEHVADYRVEIREQRWFLFIQIK